MSRLWLKVIRDHRIRESLTADCAWGEEKNALVEMCKQADLPCPMWLNKHESEFERFRHTAFLPEHFIEDVSFDRLEIEFLDDTDRRRKSDDPRNQF